MVLKEAEFLKTDFSDGVLTATLNRPKANAFNNQMIEELLGVLQYAGGDDAVRCLVLTGAGKLFSAGQDVSALGDAEGEVSFRQHLQKTFNRVIRRMRQLQKPVLGSINGPVAGAALGIALATDVRIAARSARLVFGFTGIGLTTDSGTSLSLPLMLGLSRATYMAFTNEPISAEDAERLGLVSKVVDDDDLRQETGELAKRLADGPTLALGLTKRAFNRAHLRDLEEALDYEAQLQEIAGKTQDHAEGVKAFMEKRPPEFGGA